MTIAVVGAGLAGCECAWILAEKYSQKVTLFEMKSKNPTPAQDAPHLFAELVCSNSLKSTSYLNPAGLLKIEMSALESLLIATAQKHAVPAGETLAVDRTLFSQEVTQRIRNHPNIEVVETEITSASALAADAKWSAVVVATGPLTSQAMTEDLRNLMHLSNAFFYDAIAPVLDGETIDMNIAFWQNRETRTAAYEKRLKKEERDGMSSADSANSADSAEPSGEEHGNYLNIPLNKDEYFEFVEKILAGDKVPFHEFESPTFFSGCQPIEVLAESGPRTLSFGPMKPRGLTDPRTGRMPYACIQLRRESLGGNAFNMVGFQTRLTWPAQREVFRSISALKNAEFFRMGSMHRNTYFCAPAVLSQDFSLKSNAKIFLAGQLMGVEGYIESAAIGLFAGHILGRRAKEVAQSSSETISQSPSETSLPPPETALGALLRYIFFAEPKHFAPMNIHWGLFDPLSDEDLAQLPENQKKRKIDKSLKRDLLSRRAQKSFADWKLTQKF